VPRLFHVSDSRTLTTLLPRPSPAGTPHEGRHLVWAVDEAHLPNYLLPRECPRVCWAATPRLPAPLAAPTGRVVAIEHSWVPELLSARLYVHELDPAGFTMLDAVAGYWVSEAEATVLRVDVVENCLRALAERDVEVRLTPSLWPYVDAVVDTGGEFSVIRARNARPR
jgi:hypothetical protein